MARMGLAGGAGRWWGLALGLTAFFFPGKRVPFLPFSSPLSSAFPGLGAGWRARLGYRQRKEPEKLGHGLGEGGAGGTAEKERMRSPAACPAGKRLDARLCVARKHFLRSVFHKNNNM